MNTYIFHSVNAGLFFWNGKSGLLADGIHNGKQKGFSNMPKELLKQMLNRTGIFAFTDQLLFTHLHSDHYSKAGVSHVMRQSFSSALYGPGLTVRNVAVEVAGPQLYRICGPFGNIYAKYTIHDGERFKKDPHQSYLVEQDDETFFIAGDAVLSREDAEIFSSRISGRITAGFFNLYQLYSAEGQEFVRSLPFERIFLYHLPFPKDDKFHYAKLARQISKNPPDGLPTAEILNHMSWIDNRQPVFSAKTIASVPQSQNYRKII